MLNDPPHATKIEVEVIRPPDPRNGRTLGKAYDARQSEVLEDIRLTLDRAIAEHGEDAAAWSDELLDQIARIQARQLAIEQLASQAQRRNPEWRNTPAPKEIKRHG